MPKRNNLLKSTSLPFSVIPIMTRTALKHNVCNYNRPGVAGAVLQTAL